MGVRKIFPLVAEVALVGLSVWHAAISAETSQHSPTPPSPIDERGFVKINGSDEWLTIRGDDRSNPVILYLHGGPGAATSVWAWPYFTKWGWEKHFTIAHWDQPGSGHTFTRGGGKLDPTLSFERIVDDGIDVARKLCMRLHKQKIVLVGGSWGSAVGIAMARKRPDLFSAYVGTAQVVNRPIGERIGYARVLAKAHARNEIAAVAELESGGGPPYKSQAAFQTQRKWANSYESASPMSAREIGAESGVTNAEMTAWFDGLNESDLHFRGADMNSAWTRFDIRTLGRDFKIPIFVFQGAEDDITPASEAKEYVEWIRAPSKEFVAIADGGHNVDVRKGDVFLDLLLQFVRPLAQ